MKLFGKPKDERITAQVNRYYKVGFWIMAVLILVDLYLRFSAQNFSAETGVTPDVDVSPLETIAVLAGTLYVCIQMIRHGIFDDDLRYADTEAFPLGYCLKIGAIGAVIPAFVLVGGRVYDEIIYNGIENVTWGGDVAMFVVFAVFLFIIIYLTELATWHMAAKKRNRSDE
jgi:hypothetical protein